MAATSAEPGALVFWSVAGLMLAVVVARLLWAGLRGAREEHGPAVALYEAQRFALQRASEAGDIAAEQLPQMERELARATLEDAGHDAVALRPANRLERLGLALVILVLVPAIALPVYLRYGSPAPPTPGEVPTNHMAPAQMLEELERRIEIAPDDPEPRLWLARVYMSTGEYARAIEAYAELDRLAPDQPSVLLQWADALAMRDQGRIDEEARTLVKRALALEPDNVTGLWLAGVAAEQSGDGRAALDFLARARGASLAQGLPVEELDAQAREVAARHGLAAPAVPASRPPTVADAGTAGRLQLTVSLAPGLGQDLPPDTTVFVLAKAVQGPPMPLAVTRFTLRELPREVVLDDSMAMQPQWKLSMAGEVTVVARVSRAGTATPARGDLEGSLGPVTAGAAAPLALRIDRQLP